MKVKLHPAASKNTKYWTRATPAQMRLIEAFCAGKEIIDLGGRDGSFACHLLSAGARKAMSLDHSKGLPRIIAKNLTHHVATFAGYHAAFPNRRWDVGIVSWPVKFASIIGGVIPILNNCETVVYLGKNSASTQCGSRDLWENLTDRELVKHIERNVASVLIYGDMERTADLIQEEEWGLKALDY
jgi:hypothetical protein